MSRKGNLLGRMIVFFIVFAVVGLLAWNVFGDPRIGLIIGLMSGFIVCGGGAFIWEHRT